MCSDHMGREFVVDASAAFKLDDDKARAFDDNFVPTSAMRGGANYTNLARNGSAELASAWTAVQGYEIAASTGTTITQAPIRSTAWAKNGSASIYTKMQNPADAVSRAGNFRTKATSTTGARFPVNPGSRYFAGMDVNIITHDTIATITPLVFFYDSANTQLATPTIQNGHLIQGPSTNVIDRAWAFFDAPATAVTAYVRCGMSQGRPNAWTLEIYADNWMLVEVPPGATTPLPWFDGDDAGTVPTGWSGTPHDSASWAVL
jgi:hypothetical protein